MNGESNRCYFLSQFSDREKSVVFFRKERSCFLQAKKTYDQSYRTRRLSVLLIEHISLSRLTKPEVVQFHVCIMLSESGFGVFFPPHFLSLESSQTNNVYRHHREVEIDEWRIKMVTVGLRSANAKARQRLVSESKRSN